VEIVISRPQKKLTPGSSPDSLLCRQRRHNFLSVLGAREVENVAIDLLPDAPEQKHRRTIDLACEAASGILDQAANCHEKIVVRWDRDGPAGFFSFRHQCHPPRPSVLFLQRWSRVSASALKIVPL